MSADYLIWSIEHSAWWRPSEMGYTRVLSEAGRYDRPRASEIIANANIVAFHECMIPIECVTADEGPFSRHVREEHDAAHKALDLLGVPSMTNSRQGRWTLGLAERIRLLRPRDEVSGAARPLGPNDHSDHKSSSS